MSGAVKSVEQAGHYFVVVERERTEIKRVRKTQMDFSEVQ